MMWSYISSGQPACVLQSSAQVCQSDCGVGDIYFATNVKLSDVLFEK